MYSTRGFFIYPKLKFLKDAELVWNDKKCKKEVSLYNVNWTVCEEIKRKNFNEWHEKHWPKQNIIYYPSLPENWINFLNNLTFALDYSYKEEIERCCFRAQEERSLINRGFDTSIREYCLNTAETFIDVAFFLLSDCIYDEKKKYFDRRYPHCFIKTMLLYCFWHHQTGDGLVWYNSKMDEFEKRFNSNNYHDKDEDTGLINKFLSEIHIFNKTFCEDGLVFDEPKGGWKVKKVTKKKE